MTEEKYAIFISLSHDRQLVEKCHYRPIESITCKILNRHLVTRLKISREYRSCKKKFVHFESQNAINLKCIVSLAKTLVDYFLPSLDSLDTIIFQYFWKADAFLKKCCSHIIYSFILLFIPFQTTQHIESGADINVTDETVITGKKV